MTLDLKKAGRKTVSFIVAVFLYYVVHEGAHFLYALCTQTFERVNFLFFGVQIQANTEAMTNAQIGIFCIVGVAATLSAAYILCLLAKNIAKIKAHTVRAIFYYITIAFLMTDPIYLSVLCDLFGGGDMNGIALIMPEVFIRILLGCLAVINVFIIIKFIYPTYKKAYETHAQKA